MTACDRCGADPGHTLDVIPFAVDGSAYELHVCAPCSAATYDDLAPLVGNARRARTPRKATAPSSPHAAQRPGPSVWNRDCSNASSTFAAWDNYSADPMVFLHWTSNALSLLEHARRRAVEQARTDGASWSAIAQPLGITKQAAQQRYADKPTGPAAALSVKRR